MENSKIQWCDHSWNPWHGCLKVSPGCQHCYAETIDKRWGKDVWGPGSKRERTSPANWAKPLQWQKKAQRENLRYKVFCASMADVFEDNEQVLHWRFDLFRLILATPNLDWQLLTKRPENVMKFIPTNWKSLEGWPKNVWIGTSVENQKYADERIPELLKIPARVRFLSVEPLLEPVDLYWCDWCGRFGDHDCEGGYTWAKTIKEDQAGIDWVIIGGESGYDARAFDLAWANDIILQCKAARVPVFMKQIGSNPVSSIDLGQFTTMDKKGGNPDEWPESLRVREFPEVTIPVVPLRGPARLVTSQPIIQERLL